MSRINPIVQFIIILIISLGTAFFIHITILNEKGFPPYDNLIKLSYLVNSILATVIYAALYGFRHKFKNQIGFLFIAGSFLKFIFFFILFYPTFNADGEMNGLEFGSFFVPYGISLIIETVFTSKMLKKLD